MQLQVTATHTGHCGTASNCYTYRALRNWKKQIRVTSKHATSLRTSDRNLPNIYIHISVSIHINCNSSRDIWWWRGNRGSFAALSRDFEYQICYQPPSLRKAKPTCTCGVIPAKAVTATGHRKFTQGAPSPSSESRHVCVAWNGVFFGYGFSYTPIIRINGNRDPSGYAENPDNWIFHWK
jgi:hypothetical protein